MIPLGQEESQKLEFKGRDALQKLPGIARAVVAMLNAGGGSIWIGIAETNGRGVAVQPVANAPSERDRLWNHFVDTIEPPPFGDEIQIEVVTGEGGSVLRIDMNPQNERRPYAQLKEGGRHFVVRTGARIRPMTREEVLPTRALRGADRPSHDPFAILRKERDDLLHFKQPTFWIRLQPDQDLVIAIQSEKLGQYLQDPRRSGNRESGWTFANPYLEMRIEQGRRVLGDEASGRTRVDRTGGIDHRTPLHWLTHSKHDDNEIYPLALLERTVSVFRLASAIYKDSDVRSEDAPRGPSRMKGHVIKQGLPDLQATDFQVVADLALTSAKGWKLRAYSPRSYAWMFEHHKVKGFERLQGALASDLLLERPLVFEGAKLLAEPDPCAFRLISRVYESFGLSEDMIPSEFDRKLGALVMPQ